MYGLFIFYGGKKTRKRIWYDNNDSPKTVDWPKTVDSPKTVDLPKLVDSPKFLNWSRNLASKPAKYSYELKIEIFVPTSINNVNGILCFWVDSPHEKVFGFYVAIY